MIALANEGRTAPLSSTDLATSPWYEAGAADGYGHSYRDITAGSNGFCGAVCTATTGYDFITGLGSPLANFLIPYLAAR